MIRVLFLCLGNICRSPMAEAVFKEMVRKENLSDLIEVDSAGLGEWHVGNPPHEGTRGILDRENISYDGMVARRFADKDFEEFDYIIAMDDQNIEGLKKFGTANDKQVTIAKLMDFVPNAKENNVPDPYFTGDFDYTYELVTEGCKRLLSHIKAQQTM